MDIREFALNFQYIIIKNIITLNKVIIKFQTRILLRFKFDKIGRFITYPTSNIFSVLDVKDGRFNDKMCGLNFYVHNENCLRARYNRVFIVVTRQ